MSKLSIAIIATFFAGNVLAAENVRKVPPENLARYWLLQSKSATQANVPANGAPLDLMLIRVASGATSTGVLPQALSRMEPAMQGDAPTRAFTLDQAKGVWRINRGTYRMTETEFSVKRA